MKEQHVAKRIFPVLQFDIVRQNLQPVTPSTNCQGQHKHVLRPDNRETMEDYVTVCQILPQKSPFNRT